MKKYVAAFLAVVVLSVAAYFASSSSVSVLDVGQAAAQAKPISNVACGPQCLGGGSPPPYPCNQSNRYVYTYWPYAPYKWQCNLNAGPPAFYAWAFLG